ncbi:aminodeoxychorismate/anthranilate synthase component II [Rhodopirellula sp. JC740]|uniref:Aminodeoxychorismate/anthranilate synthase component II n=1 Tax=Rhodopirellula halodulae TaxID=2894198 RepID=A0ABS8NNX6_9BACT|nr:aminodeoxychorismate/anthranilate synthase component II [Rhodopirellula sp. JC740]MCC9645069.1 aminodeoxychorismate/anthranilate synthase component II [Rhodopirellula sp. JC740]
MILLLDNYDSFVHNVARYLRVAARRNRTGNNLPLEQEPGAGLQTKVVRSDALSVDEIAAMAPSAIVISPGPHGPESAGCSLEVVRKLAGRIPILGICLGHQTIAAAYGAKVVVGPPMHGMAIPVRHRGASVFAGLPSTIDVGRYHSLRVDRSTLPDGLEVTAWAEDDPDLVMGIADHRRCVHGVQFHPESLLTQGGLAMLEHFIGLAQRHQPEEAMSQRESRFRRATLPTVSISPPKAGGGKQP